jgi:ATP-dependent helicase/nuclease subunit A
MRWTKAQQEAIDARRQNLLVSAAAGSGKTAVMVERIVSMIEEGLDVERMLVITFTRAAASQMKERIAMRLEAGDSEALYGQLERLDRASISTVHVFCAGLIRRYFHVLGVDPALRVGEAFQMDALKNRAVEEVLETFYGEGDPEFLHAAACLSFGRGDQKLVDAMLAFQRFLESQEDQDAYMGKALALYDETDLGSSPYGEWALYEARQELEEGLEGYEVCLEFCRAKRLPAEYGAHIGALIHTVEDLILAMDRGYSAFLAAAAHFPRLPAFPRKRKDTPEEILPLREELKDLRDGAKKQLDKALEHFKGLDEERTAEDFQEILRVLRPFFRLEKAFIRRYEELKQESGLMDYSDLEHLALRALREPAVAAEVRRRYQAVFVDEYQDMSLVQEAILQRVAGEDNLFMVGDVKQSIYRFRQSDPTLFLDKYDAYEKDEKAKNRRIDLNMNFRSNPRVLEGVNAIFRPIMKKRTAEVEYDEDAELHPGGPAGGDAPRVRVELILREEGDAFEEMVSDEAEALLVARRIREWVGKPVYDRRLSAMRKARYRDVAILMRSVREAGPVFAHVLAREGIPVATDAAGAFYEAVEIQVFLNYLRLVDNRRQDVPLLSALLGVGGFTTEELGRIRAESRDGSFYDAAAAYTVREDELAQKLRGFFQDIEGLRELSRHLSLSELLWHAMRQSGYYYQTGLALYGATKKANLRLLVEQARNYEKFGMGDLAGFFDYVEEARQGADVSSAQLIGENDDVVRIMTVHRSKGLEFPIVFVARLGHRLNVKAPLDPLFHKDLGVALRRVDPNLGVRNMTLPVVAVRSRLRMEGMAEEMRILYVALTRAEERLVLVGAVKPEERDGWTRQKSAKTFLDWVMPSALQAPELFEVRETLYAELAGEDEDPGAEERMAELHARLQQPETDGEWIRTRLNFVYPHALETRVPSKLAVTQLAREERVEPAELPTLFPEKTLTAMERGSLMHRALELLDFARADTLAGLKDQREAWIRRGLMTEEEGEALHLGNLLKLVQSPLGRRMAAAKLHREMPFNLLVEPRESGYEAEEPLWVQGVIDLCFLEGNAWVLVDYKNERAGEEGLEAAAKKHAFQVNLYRKALETLTGKPVKEAVVWFIPEGRGVSL